MRRIHVPALMFAALASAAWAQAPQDAPRDLPAITADLERIKADLETVKSQLAQVLRVLSQRPAQGGVAVSGPVRTSVADAPMLGRADAPVTLVEFSDYQCPFCQRFFATTLPALKREYIDAGKIRYVFRDYPLEMHALARQRAGDYGEAILRPVPESGGVGPVAACGAGSHGRRGQHGVRGVRRVRTVRGTGRARPRGRRRRRRPGHTRVRGGKDAGGRRRGGHSDPRCPASGIVPPDHRSATRGHGRKPDGEGEPRSR